MFEMSELGQHLREAREEKGLSLEDLQRSTKIQKRYLLAIEEGRFDTLPGLFYARAFVKTYAEAVGLDPEPLFDQYRNELPNPQKESIDLPSRSERSKSPVRQPKKSSKAPAFLPAVIALAFLVVIALGIWLVTQSIGGERDAAIAPDPEENVDADFSEGATEPEADEEAEGDQEAANEDAVEEEPAVEEEEEEEETSSETSTLNLLNSSGNTSYFELEADRFDVVIQFSDSSYVDVKNGLGNMFFSGQPASGEELEYDFQGEEEVEFNFGASQNVTLIVNDEEVDFPLEIIHQKINITNSVND